MMQLLENQKTKVENNPKNRVTRPVSAFACRIFVY